jgi:hypothetical protein
MMTVLLATASSRVASLEQNLSDLEARASHLERSVGASSSAPEALRQIVEPLIQQVQRLGTRLSDIETKSRRAPRERLSPEQVSAVEKQLAAYGSVDDPALGRAVFSKGISPTAGSDFSLNGGMPTRGPNTPRLRPEELRQIDAQLALLRSGADQAALFRALASVVNVSQQMHSEMGWRVGGGAEWSIAQDQEQVDYYTRLVASSDIARVCETGFNAGHSVAVWLSSNAATVTSFDRMGLAYSASTLHLLQKAFPGRLTMWPGDSLRTVPKFVAAHTLMLGESAPATGGCDLLSIDGGHEWEVALHDFLNLVPAASPRALFLFDDVGCRSCDGSGPSCATKALVASGFLEKVDHVASAKGRGWSTFRLREPTAQRWRAALTHARAVQANATGRARGHKTLVRDVLDGSEADKLFPFYPGKGAPFIKGAQKRLAPKC